MKTWKVILLMFIAFLIWVALWSSEGFKENSSKNKKVQQVNQQKSTSKSSLKDKCDQIANGDPIDKVKLILWTPDSSSVSEIAWLWKSTLWIYSENFKSCQIHFNSVNDVYAKSFVDL